MAHYYSYYSDEFVGVATFTGFRGANGRIISLRKFRQLGVVVFSKTDTATVRQDKLDEALAQGYGVVKKDDRLELYVLAPAK